MVSVNPDPDQGGQKWPRKVENCFFRNFMFWSAECSLLRAEGFFCNLDILYGGLGIVVFDPTVIFSIFLIRIGIQPKMLDPNPYQMNTDPKPCLKVRNESRDAHFLTVCGIDFFVGRFPPGGIPSPPQFCRSTLVAGSSSPRLWIMAWLLYLYHQYVLSLQFSSIICAMWPFLPGLWVPVPSYYIQGADDKLGQIIWKHSNQ